MRLSKSSKKIGSSSSSILSFRGIRKAPLPLSPSWFRSSRPSRRRIIGRIIPRLQYSSSGVDDGNDDDDKDDKDDDKDDEPIFFDDFDNLIVRQDRDGGRADAPVPPSYYNDENGIDPSSYDDDDDASSSSSSSSSSLSRRIYAVRTRERDRTRRISRNWRGRIRVPPNSPPSNFSIYV